MTLTLLEAVKGVCELSSIDLYELNLLLSKGCLKYERNCLRYALQNHLLHIEHFEFFDRVICIDGIWSVTCHESVRADMKRLIRNRILKVIE